MQSNLIPKAEIEKSRQNERIVQDTALQIIKDFRSFGIEIDFPEDLVYAYDNLYKQLVLHIENLLRKEPERLASLLYQIDLDEKKLKSPEVELFYEHEWISKLILEREFLKVLTRHYFKEGKR